MTTCDNCQYQAQHRNCKLALDRGLGVFWGDKLKSCAYREQKLSADEKRCVKCGGTGHLSHACRMGMRD